MRLVLPVLILLFMALPLAEIAVFIKVGSILGVLPTLALTVACAILGTWLVRRQGLATWQQARESLDRGKLPVVEVVDGALLVLAGFLLITPGLITDAAGFLLLLPPLRLGIARGLRNRLTPPDPSMPRTIEVDYSDITRR